MWLGLPPALRTAVLVLMPYVMFVIYTGPRDCAQVLCGTVIVANVLCTARSLLLLVGGGWRRAARLRIRDRPGAGVACSAGEYFAGGPAATRRPMRLPCHETGMGRAAVCPLLFACVAKPWVDDHGSTVAGVGMVRHFERRLS